MKNGLLDDSNKRNELGSIIIGVGVFLLCTGAGLVVSAYVK